MDLLKHITHWTQGEVKQGYIMLTIGLVLSVLYLYFADFQKPFHKGILLPLVLALLLLFGYGSYQVIQRPQHLSAVKKQSQTELKLTVEQELKKAKKDDSTYKTIKMVWLVLLAVSLVLSLLVHPLFWKGMSTAFIAFFCIAFIIDTALHSRLKVYLQALQNLDIV